MVVVLGAAITSRIKLQLTTAYAHRALADGVSMAIHRC